MRLRKLSKKYATGGFASSGQVGLPNITPVYDAPTIDKNSAQRAMNVGSTALKGASTGAAIGSVIPGVGTAIGAGVGAVGGALVGLFTNKKEEQQRKKTNAANEALYQQEKDNNLNLWKQYANQEDSNNVSAAKSAGYNTMGNSNQEFYGEDGGTIHINPANKGKFNATKKATGETTEELTHSKNPLTKERAIFAQNAKKWNHRIGGVTTFAEGGEVKKTPIPIPRTNSVTPTTNSVAGVRLSSWETENLKQYKNNPALYKKAIHEMIGYNPTGNRYPSGSQSAANAAKAEEAAIAKFNNSYSDARQTGTPKALEEYSKNKVAKEINSGPETNKKLSNYQANYNTENLITDQSMDKNAGKSLQGESITGSTANPYEGQTYEYEKASGFRKGGITYKSGGKLEELSNNTQLAEGATHEQGGIQLTPKAEIEDKETVTDKGDHLFIASAKLKNPLTGNSFAKDDTSLSKKIGKLEDASDNTANRNSLRLLNMKKSKLASIQQTINGDYGAEETEMRKGGIQGKGNRPYETLQTPDAQYTQFAKGGVMKYDDGGPTGLDTSFGIPNLKGNYTNMADQFGVSSMPAPELPAETAMFQSTGTPQGFSFGNKNAASGDVTAIGGGMSGGKGAALLGIAKTVGQGIANYGLAALEYKNQKKAIDKLRNLQIPQARLNNYANLGKVNMGVDKANVDKQVSALNTGIDRGLTDSNVAAATKASNLAQGLAAKAGVNQQERNANQEIGNRQTEINLGVQAGNNQALQAKQKAEFDKQAQVIGMDSEAYSKLMENIRGGQNNARASKFVNNQMALDAYRLPSQERGAFFNYMKNNGNQINLPNFRRGGRLTKMYC